MSDPLRFAEYSKAIDAIVEYLEERGTPATQEELIRGVIDGGYRYGAENLETDLRRVLQVYLQSESFARRQVLRELEGKVGRVNWPDERFR